jgi:hypothetical protein
MPLAADTLATHISRVRVSRALREHGVYAADDVAAEAGDIGRVVGELGRLDAERGETGLDLGRDRRQGLAQVGHAVRVTENGPGAAHEFEVAQVTAGGRLAGVLGEYLVTSFLAYKRNEIERFERFVTDWEFREYAYHL